MWIRVWFSSILLLEGSPRIIAWAGIQSGNPSLDSLAALSSVALFPAVLQEKFDDWPGWVWTASGPLLAQ